MADFIRVYDTFFFFTHVISYTELHSLFREHSYPMFLQPYILEDNQYCLFIPCHNWTHNIVLDMFFDGSSPLVRYLWKVELFLNIVLMLHGMLIFWIIALVFWLLSSPFTSVHRSWCSSCRVVITLKGFLNIDHLLLVCAWLPLMSLA